MNNKTIITYDNGKEKIVFGEGQPFWIESMPGVSSNRLNISESQSVGQIGTTITNKSVQSKTFPVNGVIFGDLEVYRQKLLGVILPGVDAEITITQDGLSWYYQGTPAITPEVDDGIGLQRFQFTFKCPYPYLKSAITKSYLIASLTPLFHTPFYTGGTWQISSFSGDAYTNIPNRGHVPIEIEAFFTARAPVTNPEIYNITTRSFIRLGSADNPVTLDTGEILFVSTVTNNKGAWKIRADGSRENAFGSMAFESDWDMVLDIGDNLMRAWADSNKESLSIEILAPEEGIIVGK